MRYSECADPPFEKFVTTGDVSDSITVQKVSMTLNIIGRSNSTSTSR